MLFYVKNQLILMGYLPKEVTMQAQNFAALSSISALILRGFCTLKAKLSVMHGSRLSRTRNKEI
jgi:hypothetical protein